MMQKLHARATTTWTRVPESPKPTMALTRRVVLEASTTPQRDACACGWHRVGAQRCAPAACCARHEARGPASSQASWRSCVSRTCRVLKVRVVAPAFGRVVEAVGTVVMALRTAG